MLGYTYANGLTITYEYDTIGNVKRILKNGTAIYSCEYDANMQLIREQDYEANTATEYFYTDAGSLYLSRKTCGDDVILSYSVTDDETGKTDHITEINGTKITYSSVYDEEAEIYKYILPNLTEITSDTDDFGRTTAVYLKDSEGNTILSCTYTYVDKTVDGAVHTSEYVASMSMGGKTFSYAYDANGNITSVSDGAYVTTYVYDNLGQLARENNQRAGKSWTYTYDTAGNILSKSEYAYTVGELGTAASAVTYGYTNSNWGDQLASYDGTAITYDSLGNPLNWTDGRTFTWEGRQLSSITSSDETISFTYNADSLRTRKVVGTGEDAYIYEYIWDNGLLISETETYYGEELVSYYYYDENGSPVAWNWDGDIYYYVKNLQGDIVKVVDEAGTTQAEYTYDAWGNVLTETGNFYVRTYNPFRYRSYYYDIETGLYYLQSRYYAPAVGRFLNADAVDYLGASGTVLGYNLYAYCENNAVVFSDYTGNEKIAIFYDNRSSGVFGSRRLGGKGFRRQANIWIDYLTNTCKYTVYKYPFKSIYQFILAWNRAKHKAPFDTIIIMSHGSAGSLDCAGQRLLVNGLTDADYKIYRFNELATVKADYLYLFSCNGGTSSIYPYSGSYFNSVAYEFALITNAIVFAAVNGKININYYNGNVSLFEKGYWARFHKNYRPRVLSIKNLSPSTFI